MIDPVNLLFWRYLQFCYHRSKKPLLDLHLLQKAVYKSNSEMLTVKSDSTEIQKSSVDLPSGY